MIEDLVTNNEAATRLGRSVGYICALKKVCGLHRATRFPVSKLMKYLNDNPTFRVQDAYGSKKVSRQQTRGRKRRVARTSSEKR